MVDIRFRTWHKEYERWPGKTSVQTQILIANQNAPQIFWLDNQDDILRKKDDTFANNL